MLNSHIPPQVLLARLTFFALLLPAIIALGWFLYPANWASRFGDTAPYVLRRAAWGMALFFAMQFALLMIRWFIVLSFLDGVKEVKDLFITAAFWPEDS